MAPPVDASKRNNAAPKQLEKLDVDAERQKTSGKPVSSSAKSSPEKKTKTKKNQPQDESDMPVIKAAAKDKPTVGKKAKVAVAVAGDDQFNDIGEAAKDMAKNEKLARGTAPKGKTRPASAGVGAPKLAPLARPASAGIAKQGAKDAAAPGKLKALNSGSPSKTAFIEKPDDANEASASQKTERALGDDEPPAKGVYDIFVQTRRCEKFCESLGLTLKHIRKMKKKFDENDMYHSGEITQAEFFFIINEDRRPLTKGILRYGNVAYDQKFMSFDEFLLCVCSFAVLTPPEVYQYVFDLYDDDKSGTLDEYEFAKMSKEMQSKQFCFPKNVTMAINMIEGKDPSGKGKGGGGAYVSDDGLVDLGEFMKFAKLFPVAFFPLFNFQKNVRKSTLGESKWSNLAARKLKIQELVSHMRRNYGAIPDLSLGQRLWSIVDDEVMDIRKRASEIYGIELAQRRVIGDTGEDDGSTS